MTTLPGRINFGSQQMSSPLTTLVRKASAHRPNGGSTTQKSTQPQSPLIHTKFRGSVATTASSYDTSRFQDEESILVDVQTSDPTVSTFWLRDTHVHFLQHPNHSQPSTESWNPSGTMNQDPHPAGLESYAHPSGSIPAITIHSSSGGRVSSLLRYRPHFYRANLAIISTHLRKI